MDVPHGSRRWPADLSLVLVSLLWGSTFVLVKNALEDVSTVLFLALRFSVAALLLTTLYLLKGGSLRGHGGWIPGLLTGGFLYAGYLLQTLGLRQTTPATSAFITSLYIVIVPILAAALHQKMPGRSEWFGVGLAAVGMALMTLNASRMAVGAGELLTLGCAFAFAGHIVALGVYSARMSTDWLALLQIGTCAAIAFGTFAWVEAPFIRWSSTVVAALAVTAVFATALAFWVQTWAQARTTPTRAALIFSTEPVFAWLTSWLFAGEVLTARTGAGALCILAGVLLVELKPSRQRATS